MLGRLLRIDAGRAAVSTPNGVILADAPAEATGWATGDLVRVDGGRLVARVARNVADEQPDRQDWWRLHRVLPNLRARARLMADLRRWFSEGDFLEVETPCLATSPGLEVHLAALATRARGEPRYLITSPEYHLKRLLSAGLERLYYLGRAFRDDEAGRHHLVEFTILEWYRAAAGPADLMADVEALVALATGRERTWTRLSVAEALSRWGRPTDDPDAIVRQLVEVVEPELAALGAVFLTDYPASLASLARLSPDDPRLSTRFEAYVDGLELANGWGELVDATEQRRRLEADRAARQRLGRPVYPIDERFLGALAAGLPPCAGIALGVDRLVMLAIGAEHIHDVVPFPPHEA